MKKTKKELEQRVKELERLVEIYDDYIEILRAGYPQIPTYDYNTPSSFPVQPFPVMCEHDWIYDYSTTAPHRKCSKCGAYESVGVWNTPGTISNHTTSEHNILRNISFNLNSIQNEQQIQN